MSSNLLAALFAVAALMVLVLWWQARSRAASERTARELAEGDAKRVQSTNQDLQARIQRLIQYEGLANADEEARRRLDEAEAAAAALRAGAAAELQAARSEGQRLRADAEREAVARHAQAEHERDALIFAAKQEATSLAAGAKERVLDAQRRGGEAIASAERQAADLVSAANARAEQIAGEALRALREADRLEQTVKALRNKIDGYGDRYLIPSQTLLDDLAEAMGHTEAGQRLKDYRAQVRDAVQDGRAATCDYVEENRRATAIAFVTDAFNGKADSILARIKVDNVGTLAQELRDAFALVNHNGEAFRDARIREDYLALRLEELKWAAIVQEYVREEREDQRRIKEQLREEERARKEYERAIRDAAKNEELVRRAMEKAEAKLASATEEQKAKYEAQLSELQTKLTEAEQRNQRALSMAQQTRRGHVYIISNVGSLGENVYKIGLTRRLEPLDRIRELGDSSVPFDFDIHALIWSEDAPALEHQLHRHFLMCQVNKVNYRKEFFRADVAHIREEVEKLGLVAKWTMTAGATEWRETQAIERRIAQDPVAREAWIKRQLVLDAAHAAVEEALGDSPQGQAAASAANVG
jgi:hypothetical protein